MQQPIAPTELATFSTTAVHCSAADGDLRCAESRLAAVQERKPTQKNAEAPVALDVAEPSQTAGTDAAAVTKTGTTAARTGAEPCEEMPFSVGVKMAQLCIARDPIFSSGLLTSPTLQVSLALFGR